MKKPARPTSVSAPRGALPAAQSKRLLALFEEGSHVLLERHARNLIRRYPVSDLAWKALGAALQGQGKDALAALRQATLVAPGDADAHNLLGIELRRRSSLADALTCYLRGIQLRPDLVALHVNISNTLLDLGQWEQAEASARRAVLLAPARAEAQNCLGNALALQRRTGEAEDAYRHALALSPNFHQTYTNLGCALQLAGRLDEAETACRYALQLSADSASKHNNLANVLMGQTRLSEARTSYRRAMEIAPLQGSFFSNWLYCLLHDEQISAADLFAAHRAFGERFDLAAPPAPFLNTREPGRALRVGFVSSDLREHPVAHFIEPVWATLDRACVELWIYSSYGQQDDVTRRLRGLAHVWRDVGGDSDPQLAARIRADRIDVLIDLSGHTAHNRLLAFAARPAPIQASWIGYPNTSGLRAMDYVLTDRFGAPPGWFEDSHVEKFARLLSSGTFAAPPGAPEVAPLPALARASVTFASVSRADKIGAQVVETWARVLHGVPGSSLVLCNMSDPGLAGLLRGRFASHGIGAERLSLRARLNMQDYLALHHEIDIVLDTWPYTGGTTTHLALWMGVPVLTLQGCSRVQCQSAAMLARMGLSDWIAHDREQFVALAVTWATRLVQLAGLRAGMRSRWHSAPLRQPETVARGLEQVLRAMWQRWCAGLPPEHIDLAGIAHVPKRGK